MKTDFFHQFIISFLLYVPFLFMRNLSFLPNTKITVVLVISSSVVIPEWFFSDPDTTFQMATDPAPDSYLYVIAD